MELAERCRHLCAHIQTLTGVHTALLDLTMQHFDLPPFHSGCTLQNADCNAYLTHLYGAYEAERWDGKYIYYCPRGLVFIATPPLKIGTPMEYCLISGPFIMSNNTTDPFEDSALCPEPLDHLPCLTTAQARALSELACAAVSSLTQGLAPPDVDSGNQATILQMMYDLTAEDAACIYPIESERRLQEHIRAGAKDAAQELLNDL